MAHTEALYNMLMNMAQAHDVDCIVVADVEGTVLLDPIFGPNAPRDDGEEGDTGGNPTNAVLSFVQAQKHLAHLPQLGGSAPTSGADGAPGMCVAGQYKDNIVVQFTDGPIAVTLASRRTLGRCLGGMLALVPAVRGQGAYKTLCSAIPAES
jgi:hypothetical protein